MSASYLFDVGAVSVGVNQSASLTKLAVSPLKITTQLRTVVTSCVVSFSVEYGGRGRGVLIGGWVPCTDGEIPDLNVAKIIIDLNLPCVFVALE